MNSKKSMIDVAFVVLNKVKKGLTFQDLFNKVVKECDITDEEKNSKLVMFYNNLTLDGRFCHLVKEDLWTLRHTADSVVNFNEDENTSISDEEQEEESEENKDSKTDSDDENNSDDNNESNEEN